MLEANKNSWFEKLFAVYNRNLIKRRFNSLQAKNLPLLKNRDKKIPLIIYANHSSWWDGLVLFEILKSRDFDSYVLMEEKQLKEFSFFRRLGAFSIVRENLRETKKSMDYATKILNSGTNKTLIIFPQGKILPNDTRPLIFYNGLSYQVKNLNKCNLIPCAIRIEFLNNYKPEIFLKFGEIQIVENNSEINKKDFTRILEKKLTDNLDLLKSDIIHKDLKEYQQII